MSLMESCMGFIELRRKEEEGNKKRAESLLETHA